MTFLALCATGSALAALVFTPICRYISLRKGLLDIPNARSSHTRPVARTGGIAIVGAIAVTLLCAGAHRPLASLLTGAAVVALLSFIDDIRTLSEKVKFTVQVVGAAIAVAGGVLIAHIDVPLLRPVSVGVLAIPLTMFWLVGVANSFNFMDGINGIASLEAVVCGVTLCMLLEQHGDRAGAILAIAVAAAAAGFLPWNLPSGSIFMGDVGSATLGFLIAGLSVRAHAAGIPMVAAALPLLPFLFDTAVTLVRRIWRRENFFSAHRTHHYQQLTDLGWTHTQVALLWFALAVCCGIAALTYPNLAESARATVLILLLALHAAVAATIVARKKSVIRA